MKYRYDCKYAKAPHIDKTINTALEAAVIKKLVQWVTMTSNGVPQRPDFLLSW